MKKVALITGGATGIGRACAQQLAQMGYDILVAYRSSSAKAEELRNELGAQGTKCAVFKADVVIEEDAARLVQFCRETFGRLDAVVNSAGTTRFIPFEDLDAVTTEVWEELLHVNLMGTFFCCREAAKLMQESGGGCIVNVASLAGMRVSGSSLPYGVSKAGVIMMTKSLAMTLAPSIRVNCVSPGMVAGTAWYRNREGFDVDGHNARQAKEIPVGRVATAEDVADTICFLISDKGAYLTGVNIPIDGGRGERMP
ncbi:MAG: SDR family oxidoreductase [Lachnospiraceae bacterium]|nr:SDR family oxidoreductase [Lachnospiraceae bacterium]